MTCPYCREGLPPTNRLLCCDRCGTPAHAECLGLHGGCTTFGCPSVTFAPRARARLEGELSPTLPLGVHLRRGARGMLSVATAPREDVALVVLAVLGIVGLLLLQV